MISVTYIVGDRRLQNRLSLSIFITNFMNKPCRLVRKCEYFWHSYLGSTVGIFMYDKKNRTRKTKEGWDGFWICAKKRPRVKKAENMSYHWFKTSGVRLIVWGVK